MKQLFITIYFLFFLFSKDAPDKRLFQIQFLLVVLMRQADLKGQDCF
jgi:hypothetical protein